MSDSADVFALPGELRVLVTAGASGIGRAISDLLIARGARVHICDVSDDFLAEFRGAHRRVGRDEGRRRVGSGRVAPVRRGREFARRPRRSRQQRRRRRTDRRSRGDPARGLAAHDRRLPDRAIPLRPSCRADAEGAGGGAIVNLSSAAGRFGYAFRTPYSAAKWGVIGFTQSLAKELGPANIRVNAILPGIVEGPRMTGVIEARATQMDVSYEAMEKTYLDRVSLRRMVTASDVAATVAYLLSPAGRNISGQSIGVDGNVETL